MGFAEGTQFFFDFGPPLCGYPFTYSFFFFFFGGRLAAPPCSKESYYLVSLCHRGVGGEWVPVAPSRWFLLLCLVGNCWCVVVALKMGTVGRIAKSTPVCGHMFFFIRWGDAQNHCMKSERENGLKESPYLFLLCHRGVKGRMGTCGTKPVVFIAMFCLKLLVCCRCCFELFVCEQIRKTQAEPQWIVAQRLLSALTIPGFT